MIKKYKPCIIFFYAFALVSLVVATFFDLDIDIALNNPSNPVAVWFKNTGEIPSRLICPIAGAILFWYSKSKFSKIVSLIFQLGGSAYLGYYIGKYFFVDEYRLAYSIIYGLGTGLIILFAFKYIKFDAKYITALKTVAVFGIVIMFLQLGVVECVKYIWGRVRFRDLIDAGSYDAFTPWYVINGLNGNKSFPSGHTAGAGMSFLLMFLPYINEKLEKHSNLLFAVSFLYTAVVAFTRLVMGAHYLSDVTVGAIISFTIVIIAMKIYESKYESKLIQISNKSE